MRLGCNVGVTRSARPVRRIRVDAAAYRTFAWHTEYAPADAPAKGEA